MIVCSVDVKKIDKALLFNGAKGSYLDITLHDKPDDYGNDGFVAQRVSKEQRQQGIQGPIIGNWREIQAKGSRPKQQHPKSLPQPQNEDQDIPF